jgi:hypothetical protein
VRGRCEFADGLDDRIRLTGAARAQDRSAELAHPGPGQAEIDWLEHLSASKEYRIAYPSDWNNVIRDYTGGEATEETEFLLELLDLCGLARP